ncbi:hypothetical protein ACWDZ6_16590 [Streptomyces sp. NPDC002926]
MGRTASLQGVGRRSRVRPSDPYRAAAWRLRVTGAACVAVEDSPDGTTSADAAGGTVLVVPSLLPVPSQPGRIFADSLEEVSLAGLRRYFADGRTATGMTISS